MKRIPIAGPWITQKEIDYVADATANAWYSNAGTYHHRFETAMAAYVGRRFAMALPSCTSAIHLALMAYGIGPGDEVIVPESTWIATSAPITYVGATPVFADVDRRTWCLSPESLRESITGRTKAVIPVDLYGNVADYDAILEIASEAGIIVIEDAAQAVGGGREGQRAGAFGGASVFSFHGSKTLTTGEGGMLLTDDETLFARASVLRDHGRAPADTNFFNREVAHKYKMSAMQAALGLAQLERIDELIARKRETFAWYAEELRDLEGVTLNHEAPGSTSTYWMNTVVLDPILGIRADSLRSQLAGQGIDTRPFFHPLSSLPAYASVQTRGKGRVAYELAPYALNLPSALSLSRDDVAFVCDSMRNVVATARAT